MSQNKTVIPESEYDNQYRAYGGEMSSSVSDFYRPSGVTANNGTVISGIDNGSLNPSDKLTEAGANATAGIDESQSRSILLQERVIIGVMFSISKGLLGEIFPIYLGRNMMGSSASCDIRLGEKSVSEEHAVIFARCDGYPGECYLTVTDYGSSHGTMVNQKDCRYETMPLSDGDILTVGKHYHLCVRLFDVSKKGLYEDAGFEDIQSTSVSAYAPNPPAYDFYAPSKGGGNDNRTVIG